METYSAEESTYIYNWKRIPIAETGRPLYKTDQYSFETLQSNMTSCFLPLCLIIVCTVMAVPCKHKLKASDARDSGDAKVPEWTLQTQYEPGAIVIGSNGKKFTCKPWPYSGWCSVYDPCISYGFMAWDKYSKKNEATKKEEKGNNNKAEDPEEEREAAEDQETGKEKKKEKAAEDQETDESSDQDKQEKEAKKDKEQETKEEGAQDDDNDEQSGAQDDEQGAQAKKAWASQQKSQQSAQRAGNYVFKSQPFEESGCRNKKRKHLVSVYFGNWKIYMRKFQLCSTPLEKVDRIYYAFLNPSSGECVLNDPWGDIQKPGPEGAICGAKRQGWNKGLKGNLYQLLEMKKRSPGLQVLASVGGWTYSKRFHKHFQTQEGRERLVNSCVDLLKKYDQVFDGLDIDLEYPCLKGDIACGPKITPSDNDRGHFTEFMRLFNKAMPPGKLLTIATTSVASKIDALDLKAIDPFIDSYNIMSYDFTSGSWGEKTTGHQTNPRANDMDDNEFRKGLSAELAGLKFVADGASANKINVGVAFYGRGFAIAAGQAPGPFVRSKGGLSKGTWENNNFDYYDLKKNYMGQSSKNVFWDSIACAPFIFDSENNRFITYEDPRSICEKVTIAHNNRFQGVFSWELSGDSDDFQLTEAMNNW